MPNNPTAKLFPSQDIPVLDSLDAELFKCRIIPLPNYSVLSCSKAILLQCRVLTLPSCPNAGFFNAVDLFPCQVISVLNNPTAELFQSQVIPMLS